MGVLSKVEKKKEIERDREGNAVCADSVAMSCIGDRDFWWKF